MSETLHTKRHEGSVRFLIVECARKSFLGLVACEIR